MKRKCGNGRPCATAQRGPDFPGSRFRSVSPCHSKTDLLCAQCIRCPLAANLRRSLLSRDVERALAGVRSARFRPASGSRRLAQSRDSLSQGFSLSKYSACLCKTPIGGKGPLHRARRWSATSAHSKLRIASAGEVPRCREDAPHRVIIQGLDPSNNQRNAAVSGRDAD